MSGEELKEKLINGGYSVTAIAKAMNIKHQELSQKLNKSSDIKTGLLEDLCKSLKIDMSFFYGNTEFLPSYFSSNAGEQTVPISLFKQILNERDFYMLKLSKYEDVPKSKAAL